MFVVVVLALTYPLSTYLRYFSIPWWSTLLSYTVFALAITVVAAIVIPFAISRVHRPHSMAGKYLDALLVSICTYVGLAALAVFIIRSEVGFPYTWVRQLFFPDWEFFRFLLYDVTALSAGSFSLRLWRNCVRQKVQNAH
jgi:hypothetical protein